MLISGQLIADLVHPDVSIEDGLAMESEAGLENNLLSFHNFCRDVEVVVHLLHAFGVGVLFRLVVAGGDGTPCPGGGQVVSQVPGGVGPLSMV